MPTSFLILCFQTIFCWTLVVFLYRQKHRFTLVPLYGYLAVLTIFTHNLSDLGFALVINHWYFLISSFTFFTSLMLAVLFLYLFEGQRAVRLALLTIIAASLFYVLMVFFISQEVDTSRFVVLSLSRINGYFWSVTAIVIDVIFLALFWEVLAKMSKLPLTLRIFLVIISTYSLDSLIFVSGNYFGQPIYWSVLQGSLLVRLVLALVITPITTLYLRTEGFNESTRDKPGNLWEIFNFRTDLEAKIQSMGELIKLQKTLETKLRESHETYSLAVEGSNAGIWDWDIPQNHITYSAKFCQLLGYAPNEIPPSLEHLKSLIYPGDLKSTFALLDNCFINHQKFSIDYRLKNKDQTYRWYSCGGIVKYDSNNKPVRMVGSIIDIDDKKKLSAITEEKVEALQQLNKFMVGRELQMVKLKDKIKKLESKK